jgi:hypothetical protein
MVFLMGLNHMDTLNPQLVGDPAWREFVASHVAILLGLKVQVERPRASTRGHVTPQGADPGVSRKHVQEK